MSTPEKNQSKVKKVCNHSNQADLQRQNFATSDASVARESNLVAQDSTENGQATNDQISNDQKKKEVEARACQTSSLNSNSNCELSQAVTGLHITTNSPKSQAENVENLQNSENNSSVESEESIVDVTTRLFNAEVVAIEKDDSGNVTATEKDDSGNVVTTENDDSDCVGIRQADVKPASTESPQRENARDFNHVGADNVSIEQAAVKSVGLEQIERAAIVSQSMATTQNQTKKSESKELTQENAFAAMFTTGQNILFSHSAKGEKVLFDGEQFDIFDILEYPFNQRIDMQYLCLNPFKAPIRKNLAETKEETRQRLDSLRRRGYNLEYRQGFTLEMDHNSLEIQRNWAKATGLAPTVQVFSGSKSIHSHFICNRPITEKEEETLKDLFKKAFPFADFAVITDKSRLCRTPAAIRDNGKLQSIESIGCKFDPENLIEILKTATIGINSISKANTHIRNLINGLLPAHGKNTEIPLDQALRHTECYQLIENLLGCGYQILAESVLYKALLEFAPYFADGFNLDQAIDETKKKIENKTTVALAVNTTPQKHTENAGNKSGPAHKGYGQAWFSSWCKWLNNELQNISLDQFESIAESFISFDCSHRSGAGIAVLCPWCGEKRPSANTYIDPIDKIAKLHCHHPTSHTANIYEIARYFGGLTRIAACQAVFGKLPPTWCNECGKEITFDGDNHPHNVDGTLHRCLSKQCQYCGHEITFKAGENGKSYPCNMDGTRHDCQAMSAIETGNQDYEASIQKNAERPRIQIVNTVLDDFQQLLFSEILAKLGNIRNKQVKILYASTGGGKTYALVYQALIYISMGYLVIFHTATKENVDQAYEYAREILAKEPEKFPGVSIKDIEIVESGRSYEGLESELQQQVNTKSKRNKTDNRKRKTYKKMILTSYGYVGRQGDLPHGYKCYHEMIEDRICIYDESQKLLHIANIQIPLIGKYHRTQTTCRLVGYCPKSARKGDCTTCEYALKTQEPEGLEKERKFFPSFSAETLESYKKFEDSATEFGLRVNEEGLLEVVPVENDESLSSLMFDIDKYLPVCSTLFCRELTSKRQDLLAAFNGDGTAKEFIRELRKTLVNPHIRMELPIDKKTGKPLAPAEIADKIKSNTIGNQEIQYPKQPCQVPILCGFDSLFLYQLMGMDVTKRVNGQDTTIHYKGAKAVIFASATVPQTLVDQIEILKTNERFEPAEKLACTDIPCQFNIKVLSTEREFSLDTTKEIFLACVDHGQPALVVTAKKNEYLALRNSINGHYSRQVTFFEDGFFFEDRKVSRKNKSPDLEAMSLLTYARSAVLTGENFPEFNLLIVDCSFFGPMITLMGLEAGMNTLERTQELYKEIFDLLTQIVGRILRTDLQRIAGKTIQDFRQLTVVLHGMPKGLQFDVDSNLCIPNTYQHIAETWYDTENIAETTFDSITKALSGAEIPNYQIIAAQKAAAKQAKQLSKHQRELATTNEGIAARQETKASEAAEQLAADYKKIVAAKQLGLTYKQIAVKFNIARNPELRNKTRQLFNMPLDEY